MKTIDYRNESWAAVQFRVVGLRLDVWRALLRHGPCTTRELAERSGLDLLTVRPRVTELCQLDFAQIDNPEAPGHEGVYRAIGEEAARSIFHLRRSQTLASGAQQELALV